MPISSEARRELYKLFSENKLLTRKEDLACYAYDATPNRFMPEAVLLAQDASDVSALLRLANRFRFPVVPRGSGTGMSGGSLPVAGGVVLAMSAMNRILEIDSKNLTAVAEPGVITSQFKKAVDSAGLFYPPDPSSSDVSTLGGNVAECAGGPRAVKYGVTRDYVLGLELVLPTGEIINTGASTRKGVVGYDLTRLIVGSEGTLGVITKIIFRLLPKPEKTETCAAVFACMDDAAIAVSSIIQEGIIPSAIEYMDQAAIRCAEAYSNAGLPEDAGAILLMEADGSVAEVESTIQNIEVVCEKTGAVSFSRAGSDHAARLWKVRKAISPALFFYGPDKINEDIVVPQSRIPDMVRFIENLRRKTGLMMVTFGHAGDGNMHVNVMYDSKDPAQKKAAEWAIEKIFDQTLKLGGTISGEHGVGITKAPFASKELSQPVIALMRRIKSAFDPAGILNPHKMLV